MPIIKHIPIYAAPKRMLAYVTNEEKTENTLVTGLNCSENYNDAYEDMKFNFEMYSGERFFKRSIKSDTAKRERQKIRLHHYIQSFKPGEVTPEEAHQIGVEWAEKVFGKKHMVLCATHTDRGHIHNHFDCNALLTAFSIPPQQGTSILTTVTLFISLLEIIAVSFSA